MLRTPFRNFAHVFPSREALAGVPAGGVISQNAVSWEFPEKWHVHGLPTIRPADLVGTLRN